MFFAFDWWLMLLFRQFLCILMYWNYQKELNIGKTHHSLFGNKGTFIPTVGQKHVELLQYENPIEVYHFWKMLLLITSSSSISLLKILLHIYHDPSYNRTQPDISYIKMSKSSKLISLVWTHNTKEMIHYADNYC